MAVRVVEVEAAPIVPGVDLVALLAAGVRPVREAPITNPREDRVEFALADQESIMLGCHLAVRASIFLEIHIVQRGIPHSHHGKRAEQRGRREAQNLRHERGRGRFVVGGDDGMVQLDSHACPPSSVVERSYMGYVRSTYVFSRKASLSINNKWL